MSIKTTRRHTTRVYWPSCTICQYMKRHQDFRLAILNSTYFNEEGIESPNQVMKRYGVDFKIRTMYSHFQRHMYREIYSKTELAKQPVMIQGVPSDIIADEGGTPAEIGLEQFIKLGTAKLNRGELPINASNYLQAIKIQTDKEIKTKDRKADLFKTMFKGAAPGPKQSEGS